MKPTSSDDPSQMEKGPFNPLTDGSLVCPRTQPYTEANKSNLEKLHDEATVPTYYLDQFCPFQNVEQANSSITKKTISDLKLRCVSHLQWARPPSLSSTSSSSSSAS